MTVKIHENTIVLKIKNTQPRANTRQDDETDSMERLLALRRSVYEIASYSGLQEMSWWNHSAILT